MIDIKEQELVELDEELFNILLMDRTLRKNICWATDNYLSLGERYSPQEPITIDLVTGKNANVVQPRVLKDAAQQLLRTREKAEVFTPSWVCNEQNNLVDTAWFGREDVFNKVKDKGWTVVKKKIKFDGNKTWQDYVDARRMEVSCGEAPYLVSRYDTVSGKEIPLIERIGLLDRKLRVINENVDAEDEWFNWTTRAYESTYGYEYQGDNILLARENLLYTLIDNMMYKFNKIPSREQLRVIARIISWNIWQMDGITMTVPYGEQEPIHKQLSLFDDGSDDDKEPIPCKIFDWRSNESIEFKSLL